MLPSNAMKTPILALILAIVFGNTAVAQSSFMDLSKPMTGKTRFVIDADGKPIEFGVPLGKPVERSMEGSSTTAPRWPGARAMQDDGPGTGSSSCGGSGTSCATDGSKTVAVRSYTRKDGTYVAPHQQTNPNSATRDNYNTRGNYNPYNGKVGTKSPKD